MGRDQAPLQAPGEGLYVFASFKKALPSWPRLCPPSAVYTTSLAAPPLTQMPPVQSKTVVVVAGLQQAVPPPPRLNTHRIASFQGLQFPPAIYGARREHPRIRNRPSQHTVNTMDWEPRRWLCPHLLSLRTMLALVQGTDTSSPQGQAFLPPAWDLLCFVTGRCPEGRGTELSVGKSP